MAEKRGIAACLAGLGGTLVCKEETWRGAVVLGGVKGLLQSMGAVLNRENQMPYEKSLAAAQSQLGEEEFEKAIQEGRAMSMEQAIDMALATEVIYTA